MFVLQVKFDKAKESIGDGLEAQKVFLFYLCLFGLWAVATVLVMPHARQSIKPARGTTPFSMSKINITIPS